MSFEFGIRPGDIVAEPEEMDVDAEEADPVVKEEADLSAVLDETHVLEVLDQLDQELIALLPVKTRIREIAALIGPGAWSIDARLFGWRRVEIRGQKSHDSLP